MPHGGVCKPDRSIVSRPILLNCPSCLLAATIASSRQDRQFVSVHTLVLRARWVEGPQCDEQDLPIDNRFHPRRPGELVL